MQTNKEFNILLADDDITICNMMKYLFQRKSNVKLDIVHNGKTALSQIMKKNYQIVISDINMPGMKGTDLLKEIKKYNGMIQVIIITSYQSLSNVLDSLRGGAFDVFFKPFDMKELLESVDEIIAKFNKWDKLLKKAIASKH